MCNRKQESGSVKFDTEDPDPHFGSAIDPLCGVLTSVKQSCNVSSRWLDYVGFSPLYGSAADSIRSYYTAHISF